MALKKPKDPAKLSAYYEKLNAKRKRKREARRPAKEEAKRLALLPIVGADFLQDVPVGPHGPFRPVEEYSLGITINDIEVL